MKQDSDDLLRRQLSRQIRRLRTPRYKGVLGLLITGGTAGLLLVAPMVAGAYLGHWLDEQASAFSERWTVNLILLGLAFGAYNVYLFFREHGQ